MASLHERVQAVVDDRLLEAYADSVKHFGTSDLVLILDVAKEDVQADLRTKFAAEYRAHLGENEARESTLLAKVDRPATSAMKTLKGPLAFWLVVTFPDGEMACLAVGGQRLANGSIALS